MKRALLLMFGAAILLLNTMVIPTLANADAPNSTSCGGTVCKP